MKLYEVRCQIREDCRRFLSFSNTQKELKAFRILSLLLRPEVLSVALYRMSHYFLCHDYLRFSRFVYGLNLFITGVDIDPRSKIGGGLVIVHTYGTVIRGTIGNNVTLYAHVIIDSEHTHGIEYSPIIGDDVSLASCVSVIGDVRISDGTFISAYSLVTESVDQPGMILRSRPSKTIVKKKP